MSWYTDRRDALSRVATQLDVAKYATAAVQRPDVQAGLLAAGAVALAPVSGGASLAIGSKIALAVAVGAKAGAEKKAAMDAADQRAQAQVAAQVVAVEQAKAAEAVLAAKQIEYESGGGGAKAVGGSGAVVAALVAAAAFLI